MVLEWSIPVEDPVLDVGVRILSDILSLVPVGLDGVDKRVLGCSSGGSSLLAALAQVSGELLGVPITVWRDDLGVPVLLNKFLEICAISWGWVGDIVIGQPSVEIGLVPLVVYC